MGWISLTVTAGRYLIILRDKVVLALNQRVLLSEINFNAGWSSTTLFQSSKSIPIDYLWWRHIIILHRFYDDSTSLQSIYGHEAIWNHMCVIHSLQNYLNSKIQSFVLFLQLIPRCCILLYRALQVALAVSKNVQ